MEVKRCSWVKLDNPLYVTYHDNEWGIPVHNDKKLYEFLVLEGAQAGLSWETILNKRNGHKDAFKNFDYERVSRFTQADTERCMHNPNIVRNRLKIKSAVQNARALKQIRNEYGSFSKYFWSWNNENDATVSYRELSLQISNDLKKRGFTFVGPEITYAFMQAVGMAQDHETGCFLHNMGTTHIHTK